jgi:sulfur carrier protein ThiS
MLLKIEKPKQEKTMFFEGVAEKLLLELKINPEEVLVVKNGEIITLEEQLEDSDTVEILSVVSGG